MSTDELPTVRVSVRSYGGAYVARAGRGKAAKSASSTNCDTIAARHAAAKYFGHADPVHATAEEIELSFLVSGLRETLFTATLTGKKGGAA